MKEARVSTPVMIDFKLNAQKKVLHGYKGFTVVGFRKKAPLDHGLSIDIEMVIRSYRLRLKRTEFPVQEIARPFGETRFKILPTAKKLIKYLWSEVRREAYRDKTGSASHD